MKKDTSITDTSFKDPYLIKVDNETWNRLFEDRPINQEKINKAVEFFKKNLSKTQDLI